MDTLIKVTNDTLGIENVTATPTATASVSTLGLSSQVNPYQGYKKGKSQGYQNSYNKNSGKAAGKGRTRRNQKRCQIHYFQRKEQEATTHNTWECPEYHTARERRDFWAAERRKNPALCMNCLTIHKDACKKKPLGECPAPNCGEKHFQNLCDKREAEMNSKAKLGASK